jgi:hypothetical protein
VVKTCKIHKIEYQSYSTIPKCPLCLKEKKNERTRRKSNGEIPTNGSRIQGQKKSRPIDDRGKRTFSLDRKAKTGRSHGQIEETARHKEEKRELAKIKADKICHLGMVCESCEEKGNVDLSHFIPGSRGSRYKTLPEASCLSCRWCHNSYEHLQYQEIAKFKNLRVILDFLETRSYGRYLKITEGIAKALINQNKSLI